MMKKLKKTIKETIDEYMSINDNGSVSPSILWDGTKAVLRGKCIELASHLKKHRRAKQAELESEIRRLEQIHKINRDKKVLSQLKDKKVNLDKLLTYKAEGAMRFTDQKYYEMGNRASRLLAFQLRKAQASRVVPKIRHPSTKKRNHTSRANCSSIWGFFLKSSTHQKHQIRKVIWIIFLVT